MTLKDDEIAIRKRQDEDTATLEKLERDERIEIRGIALGLRGLAYISKRLDEANRKLDRLLAEDQPTPLSSIRLAFGGSMSQTVTLASGQSVVASVLYFDSTGAAMPSTFVPPTVAFTIDNAAIATSTPDVAGQTSVVAYVSAGVANLTASVTSAEGLALTDTESVTCSPVVIPPPVLSSIRIDFGTPTP